MVTTKLNLSMTEPQVRQIYAKQGDTGRVLDITLDQTPEDGTLRILRPDGVEVTSEAVTGGEVESGSTFESLTEADVTELSVGIEPVQDLNGYDKPWVGGAGKNKLNNTATTATYRGITFTVNSDGTVTANGTASGGDAQLNIPVDTSSVYGDFYFNALYGYSSDTSFNAYMWDTTTGARCKQWDGTTNSVNSYNGTLRQVKIVQGHSTYMTIRVTNGVTANNVVFYPMIVASTETDNAWQPYSNICPITGHDGVTVTRTGINVWDEEWELGAIIASGNYPSTTNIRSKNYIPCMGGATYFSKCSAQIVLFQYDGNKTLIRPSADPYIVVNSNNAFTTLTNARYMRFYTQLSYGTTYNNDISINYPSTDHDYHAYDGNTYTTSLGQTVYGGTLDMVSGVLTVDRAEYKLSDMTATLESNNRWFFTSLQSVIKIPSSTSVATTTISDRFVAMSNVEMANTTNIGLSVNGQGNLIVRNGSSTDQPTGQIVIPLATPVEYQLTAQQIKTLVGTNNVWASSGDIVSITFTYGGLLSELPSDATSIVGKCYCDIEQNGVSSMPFTLNVKKNERES